MGLPPLAIKRYVSSVRPLLLHLEISSSVYTEITLVAAKHFKYFLFVNHFGFYVFKIHVEDFLLWPGYAVTNQSC